MNNTRWIIAAAFGLFVAATTPSLAAAECMFCVRNFATCEQVEQNPNSFTDDVEDICDEKPDWYEVAVHRFDPEQQGLCSGMGGGEIDPDCRACEGPSGSDCHTIYDDGLCHEPCDGVGSFAAALEEVRAAVNSGDAAQVAALLTGTHSDVIALQNGRIGVEASCGGQVLRAEVPLPLDLQVALELPLRRAALLGL